jgi:hypothetical protein
MQCSKAALLLDHLVGAREQTRRLKVLETGGMTKIVPDHLKPAMSS